MSQECSSSASPWGVDVCFPRAFPFFPSVEEKVAGHVLFESVQAVKHLQPKAE